LTSRNKGAAMAAAEAWWNKGAAIVFGKKFFRVQI
jgi:hypothetical protein